MEVRVDPHPGRAAAAWIADRLRDAARERGSAALAVSGGSTAPPMIEALLGAEVPWPHVGVWQVDERVAADGHPDRNATQLLHLPDVGAAVHLMPVTARDRRRAAGRYAAGLPARFDVVHLGLGDDGHTASWPPGLDAIRDSERAVELVADFHGYDRMTLTRRVVDAARARAVLTTGAAKRTVVERWLRRDPELPASALPRTDTWLFLDPAADPDRRGG